MNVSIQRLAAQLVLVGLVTVTPWLFGGVEAAVQSWLFAGVVAALACWLLRRPAGETAGAVLPVAVVTLVCGVLFGVFQLIPLKSKTAGLFSPHGVELRNTLGSGPSASSDLEAEILGLAASSQRQPISLYPAATRRGLALLALGVAVFVLGAAFFDKPPAQIWLCITIAVNGAGLALFGLIQKLTWNGLLYWKVPMSQSGSPFGPFVNQNNAGGFLNLCLAGAVGMTVWAVGRGRSNDSAESSDQPPADTRWGANVRQRLLAPFVHLNATTLVALSLSGCIIAGILCSLSRGAGVAMVGAMLLTTVILLFARRPTAQKWCFAVAATAGLALVTWAGMRQTVHARFATLADPEAISQHVLIPHWRDALRAVPDFWRTGSGLGTYRYVYGMYQHRPFPRWFHHAENQYLELLVESGIPGLALVLITIGLVGIATWRLVRDDPDARAFAFGIAGLFALTGQVIHAFCDFGLQIPANMMLFALLCGAACGRAAVLARCGRSFGMLALPRALSPSTLLAAFLLVAAVLGYREIRGVEAVRTALRSTRFRQQPEDLSPQVLSPCLGQLAAAVENRPDDAEAQQRLAGLWTDLYRVRVRDELRQEMTFATDQASLWNLTSPAVVHGRAHQFVREDGPRSLERLRGELVIRDHLVPALKHLVLARRSCPLLPGVHLRIAELCVLVADPASDRIHIRRSRRLAPFDAELQFRCGLLDFQAGRLDEACASWRRCLALNSPRREDIFRIMGRRLESPETIRKLLPDSPRLLVQLAETRFAAAEHTVVRRLLVQRAARLLEQADLPEDERHHLRGSICVLKEAYPEAIENYSRAVALRSDELAWRYELALLLKQQGMLEEAHEHAKRCAREAPRDRKYFRLLERIHQTQLRQ